MSTPILPFAVWESGTNQNSVPANDNSLRNQILNGLVISDTTDAEPALVSPADDGAIYIMTGAATGLQWATFDEFDLAIFMGGTWYAFAPVEGVTVNLAGVLVSWNGAAYVPVAGGAAWGSITGTLSAQTDLQAALDAKAVPGIPQNSQSAAYTAVLGDANKHILHPSADVTARNFTIPANSSVAFPIGTTLTFVNQNGAGVISILITTDTMRLAGAGTTGTRSLAANGVATALKITSTEWIISGTGLT